MNHIAIRDNAEGQATCRYELEFKGEEKPEKTDRHGASINSADSIHKNADGNWVMSGGLNGGIDACTYDVKRLRMAFDDPSRIDIKINDKEWKESSAYDTTTTLGSGHDDDGNNQDDSATGPSDGGDTPENSGGSSDLPAAWKALQAGGRLENLREDHGVVNRRPVTADHETVYIGHGEFGTGLGLEEEPFGTVQDAFNWSPRGVHHEYMMQLTPGHHDGEPGNSIHTDPHYVSGINSSRFRLVGSRDRPQDYKLEADQMNIELYGSCLESKIEGVHLHGTVQTYRGSFAIEDCIMTTNGRGTGRINCMLDSYKGTVVMIGTRIRGDSDTDAVMNLTEGSHFIVHGNCSIDADAPLCAVGAGGGTVSIHPGAEVDVPQLTPDGWNAAGAVIRDWNGNVADTPTGGSAIVQTPD